MLHIYTYYVFELNLNYLPFLISLTKKKPFYFSFKERGSLNVLQLLPLDKKKIGVVIASIGNDAIGICHYGAKLGIPVVVVVPVTIPICKLQNCYSLGAKVILEGSNLTESQRFARSLAKDKGLTYINA